MADDFKPSRRKPVRDPEARIAAEIEAAKALKIALGADADDAELFKDMIEGETSLYEMIDAVYENIRQDEEILDGIKIRVDEIETRKKRVTERRDWRKAKLEQALIIFGEKIERPEVTFSVSTRQPKAIVTEEAEIPARFWKAGDPKLDKVALLEALKAGEAIPGATLSNSPQTLTVRPR